MSDGPPSVTYPEVDVFSIELRRVQRESGNSLGVCGEVLQHPVLPAFSVQQLDRLVGDGRVVVVDHFDLPAARQGASQTMTKASSL